MQPTFLTATRAPRPRHSLFDLLRLWRTRRQSRLALSRLDARLLDDCGLTPGEAMREASRPFWRL